MNALRFVKSKLVASRHLPSTKVLPVIPHTKLNVIRRVVSQQMNNYRVVALPIDRCEVD